MDGGNSVAVCVTGPGGSTVRLWVWVTWGDRWVSTPTASYKGHRYPVEIINHCVWLYFRFPLSFREVEELMRHGVSWSAMRRSGAGVPSSGRPTPTQLLRRRPRPSDRWHLDEMFVKINGPLCYLRRAVDQHGNGLDVLVQSRRKAKAAKGSFA